MSEADRDRHQNTGRPWQRGLSKGGVRFGAPSDRAWYVAPGSPWENGYITYVATDEGWLYLVAVEDLFTREVVGWSMSDRIDTRLVVDAL